MFLLYFLYYHISYCLYQFFFIWTQRTPFNISCKPGLFTANSLSFYLSGNFRLHLKKNNFAAYMILDWLLFSFKTFQNFQCIIHCLLSHIVSDEESTANLTGITFSFQEVFLSISRFFFFVFGFQRFDLDMSECGSLYIYRT